MTNKEYHQNETPNQKARRRLFRNKPAVAGLIWIGISALLAFLAYLIIPDATPNANDQNVELALQSPGFKTTLLKVKKNRAIAHKGFFHRLWNGAESEFRSIPILNYEIEGDSIYYEKYLQGSETGQAQQKHLVDVAFALAPDQNLSYDGQVIHFTKVDEKKESIAIAQLKETVIDKNIKARTYYLGTDKYGRSMLSRLILGVRISLMVGLIAVLISLTIGMILGAVAGYFGGRVDDLIMLLINTVWSIPTLLLVFAIVLALGRGVSIIFIAVGLTMWVDVARIVRGQVMAMKQVQFVEAAQSMGFRTWRILSKHLIPNILGPVMVIAAANFAMAILIEAGLSYLGFGIQPPTPSWGTMLNENYGYAISGKPFLALAPALAIMLMVLSFNLVGNGLRDALDVKSKTN